MRVCDFRYFPMNVGRAFNSEKVLATEYTCKIYTATVQEASPTNCGRWHEVPPFLSRSTNGGELREEVSYQLPNRYGAGTKPTMCLLVLPLDICLTVPPHPSLPQ